MTRHQQAQVSSSVSHRKRNDDPNNIPRAPNSFILYRSDRLKEMNNSNVNQNVRSREIGEIWRNEPQEVRDMYARMAKQVADMHKEKYPDYTYTPNRSQNRESKGKNVSSLRKGQSSTTDRRTRTTAVSDKKWEQSGASSKATLSALNQPALGFNVLTEFPQQLYYPDETEPDLCSEPEEETGKTEQDYYDLDDPEDPFYTSYLKDMNYKGFIRPGLWCE